MKYLFSTLGILFFFISASHASNHKDCTQGWPDPSLCVQLLQKAELRLIDKEKDLCKKVKNSQLPEGIDRKEAINAIKTSNIAWRKFRDSECHASFLIDGTSAAYLSAFTAACKLQMTNQRIESIDAAISNLN